MGREYRSQNREVRSQESEVRVVRRASLVFRSLFRNLFRRSRVDRELSEEMSSYIELLVARKIRDGASPDEARRTAMIEFGGVDQVKERVRDVRLGRALETVWQDISYGLRVLRKSPMFTAVAVATLALGIGANSAIFSIVNTVLLRPLPFPEPERLVILQGTFHGSFLPVISQKDLADFRDENRVFENLVSFTADSDYIVTSNRSERLNTADVGAGFFELLRVNTIIGRTFNSTDKPGHRLAPDYPITGADGVAIIGEGFWKERFGSDPNIIGKTVTVDGYPSTIIGVVPDRFEFVGQPKLWFPYYPNPDEARDSRNAAAIGRLKPGSSIGQASAEVKTIASGLERLYPEYDLGIGAAVTPLRDWIVGDVRSMLLLLFGAVALVLLIACANVANLLLAKASGRSYEVAIRSALGASRSRLIRQLLTESSLISALGMLTGLVTAVLAIGFVVKIAPRNVPFLSDVGFNGRVIGFTFVLSFGTTLIFGLAPALQIAGLGVSESLKEVGRSTKCGRLQTRMRSLLVISELAISLVLLVASGLLIRSFYRLRSVDPGFDPHNVTIACLDIPEPDDKGTDSRKAFYDRMTELSDSLRGAESSALTCWLPLSAGASDWEGWVPEGRPFTRSEFLDAQYRRVGPGFFGAMHIPIIKGRDFTKYDGRTAHRVVIVSRDLSAKIWPGQDPVGKRLMMAGDEDRPIPHEVVGVVVNVKWSDLSGGEDTGAYVPIVQDPMPFLYVVARSTKSGENLGPEIEALVGSVDPALPVYGVRTMDQALDVTLALRRFNLWLASIFASLALVLAAVGTYGVISYGVAERAPEVALRVALGATGLNVVSLVVGNAFKLALAGIGIGLVAALAMTRVLSSFLFNIGPRDPLTYSLVAAFLLTVSLVASYLPARRATRIEPALALRYE